MKQSYNTFNSKIKILAVDTTSKSCSVGVFEDRTILSEITNASGTTHSKHLMSMINTSFGLADITISDIYCIAVTTGPGSFTGLRIGLSTIKGLAYATNKPVVGVSSLEALALGICFSELTICPILDARLNEVYFSRYKYKNGILKNKTRKQVASPDDALKGIDEYCIFIGNGAVKYKELITKRLGSLANFAPDGFNTIHAFCIAELAKKKILAGKIQDSASLELNYSGEGSGVSLQGGLSIFPN